MKTIEYLDGCLYLLDQTALPGEKRILACSTCNDTAQAIKNMTVRGAPAIGVTAAYGLVLAAYEYKGSERKELDEILNNAKKCLASTRPTAVNLFWALQRMARLWETSPDLSPEELRCLLENEANIIYRDDLESNKKMGLFGRDLVPSTANVLTHCNAGALATAGYGTALGIIRAAFEQGKNIHVFADETRPLLQGARLTAWELLENNIPVTLITDSTAGYLMQLGKIDLVIVGADRIAANGDTANKIGTYSVAVLACEHHIPFYVAAPFSTIDLSVASGQDINIEERDHDEIRRWGNIQLAPENVQVYNPAFDITPARFISAIITDRGIVRPPFLDSIKKLSEREERGGVNE